VAAETEDEAEAEAEAQVEEQAAMEEEQEQDAEEELPPPPTPPAEAKLPQLWRWPLQQPPWLLRECECSTAGRTRCMLLSVTRWTARRRRSGWRGWRGVRWWRWRTAAGRVERLSLTGSRSV
jgi:hypothetical protein